MQKRFKIYGWKARRRTGDSDRHDPGTERELRKIAELERMIRQERLAFIELHREKRRQLEELQEKLRLALETEAELHRNMERNNDE
jgi:hypothetical protein